MGATNFKERCETCKHWAERKYGGRPKTRWGKCTHLGSGAEGGIEIYSNHRDGEWVETTVETEPEWYCKEWEVKEVKAIG